MFISCTAWHHVYYDYLTVTSSVQLPGQLLKVCTDRRYSKIQNAGDCVARTGVREIGFKFGSLPHDPGGITCMGVIRFRAKCRENHASVMFFFLTETYNAENKATVYLIFSCLQEHHLIFIQGTLP